MDSQNQIMLFVLHEDWLPTNPDNYPDPKSWPYWRDLSFACGIQAKRPGNGYWIEKVK